MPGPYETERIEGWVADFLGGDAARPYTGGAREYAGEVLVAFLSAACDVRGVPVTDVEEPDLRHALLGPIRDMGLPGSVTQVVPDMAADLLTDLERQGRLGGGAELGRFVRALRSAFTASRTVVRPSAKVGANDPCPCGSGRKYKRCCRGMLS